MEVESLLRGFNKTQVFKGHAVIVFNYFALFVRFFFFFSFYNTCCVSVFAGHYGKENFRSGQDMHNFISSGFVTIGRSHLKGNHTDRDLMSDTLLTE